jgi:hypothetical protein
MNREVANNWHHLPEDPIFEEHPRLKARSFPTQMRRPITSNTAKEEEKIQPKNKSTYSQNNSNLTLFEKN